MLAQWDVVTEGTWWSNSHPAGGDRMGWLILNDGECVQWMMRPGGLGLLRRRTGETTYLLHPPR